MRFSRKYVALALTFLILGAGFTIFWLHWQRIQEPQLTLLEQVEGLVDRQASMDEVLEVLGPPSTNYIRVKEDEIRWEYRPPHESGYASIVLEFDRSTKQLKSFSVYAT